MLTHRIAVVLLALLTTGPALADTLKATLLKTSPHSQLTSFQPHTQVFVLNTELLSNRHLQLTWNIADGYQLYRDKITVSAPEDTSWKPLQWPEHAFVPEGDPQANWVYTDELVLDVFFDEPLQHATWLELSYQGCATTGYCYPPVAVTIHLDPALKSAKQVYQDTAGNQAVTFTAHNPPTQASNILQTQNPVLITTAFMIMGLALAFSPCVLPMLPILSGMMVSLHDNHNRQRTFWMCCLYVLSMATAFATAGLLTAWAGHSLQASLQNPAVIVAFALLFVLLALSLFDIITLRSPIQLNQSLPKIPWPTHGVLGVMFMGASSSLVVSPCITPPLVGALAFMAQTGDKLLGASALFALGLGMGAPLLVIGWLGTHILPPGGAWMTHIKQFFGLLMLFMAVWLLDRVLASHVILSLLSLLCLLSAFLLARRQSTIGAVVWAQRLAVVILTLGALGQINMAITQHASDNSKSSTHHVDIPHGQVITETHAFKQAMQTARASHQPIVVDFYADWCTACQKMKQHLSSPKLQQALSQITWLEIDVTAYTAEQQQLQQSLGVFGPPTYLFFGGDGHERTELRLVGETSPDQLLQHLYLLDARPTPD